MRRTIIPAAALFVAGVLLFSGCSGTGGGGPTSIDDVCGALKAALTEVSNDVEAALADTEPSEVQADLEEFADGVDKLAETADNTDVADALATLSEGLAEAAAEVADLPTDAEGNLDPDVLSEQQTGIEEAVEKVNAACTESTGQTGG